MPLDPDLEAFLELAELGRMSGKSKPMNELSVAAARLEFESTSTILDPSPPGSIDVATLKVPTRDGASIEARLYRNPAHPHPEQQTILYFHGGGYVVGSLDSHDSICRRLASNGEYAVLAPDYRLAPEAMFPTAVHDALDTANWLAEQAFSLQLDPHAVVFAGDSVGASLATVLARAAVATPQDIALKPKAQLLFYPVTDMSAQRPSHQRFAEGYLLETATLEWFYQHYCTLDQRQDWRASPLLAEHPAVLAPAYISLAEYDPLHDEGVAYAKHLQAQGTAVTLVIQKGLTHDFLRMSGITPDVARIYTAVNEWLGGVGK